MENAQKVADKAVAKINQLMLNEFGFELDTFEDDLLKAHIRRICEDAAIDYKRKVS